MIFSLARRKVGLLVPAFPMTASIYKNPGSDFNLNDWYKNHSIFDMEKTTPLTKEKYEGLHDTSKFTRDFKKVFSDTDSVFEIPEVTKEDCLYKDNRYKKLVDDFREIISAELTSDWGDNKDLTPTEVYMAFKEAIKQEGQWFKKHSDRCDDLLSLVNGHRPVTF